MTGPGGLEEMRRPSRLLRNLEIARSTWEFGAYTLARPLGRFVPRGDGHGVLVLPGFMAADLSTRTLRAFLRRRGYDAQPWRLGRNLGPTESTMDGLPRRLHELYARTGRPVSLIGQSLGGVFARDMARLYPEKVRLVITLASPFRLPVRYTGPDLTNASGLYRILRPRHTAQSVQRPEEEDLPPLTVPRTAIYTRTDGVVPWRSCLEQESPTSENVEIWGSHIGLGHNPLALIVIADRLAQPEGEWEPFRHQPNEEVQWSG